MASTGEVWKLGHRPALDGLRGVAVLLVIVCHAVPHRLTWAAGVVGVTVFFTLSGFLITALMLEEIADSGRLSLRAFYARRARRLLPALGAMVAVTAGLLSFVGSPYTLWPVVGYYANWAPVNPVWEHLWSLAVEEQFYIAWPLILGYVVTRLGRRWLLLACSAGVAWAWAVRLAPVGDVDRITRGTDARLDALLLGAAMAAALVGRRGRLPRLPASLALVGLVALCATGDGWFGQVVTPALAALVTLPLLTTGSRLLSWSALRYVGRRSYALYLWHYPALVMAGWVAAPALAAVLLTAVLAEVSWRLVERRIRDRWLSGKGGGVQRAHVGVRQDGSCLDGELVENA